MNKMKNKSRYEDNIEKKYDIFKYAEKIIDNRRKNGKK